MKIDLNPVVIYWVDSTGTHGWNSKDTEKSDMECISVGHLISKSSDRVTIIQNIAPHQHGNRMEIPLCAVKKIKRLK